MEFWINGIIDICQTKWILAKLYFVFSKVCSFVRDSCANLVSFKIVILFVLICIERTTILKGTKFPHLSYEWTLSANFFGGIMKLRTVVLFNFIGYPKVGKTWQTQMFRQIYTMLENISSENLEWKFTRHLAPLWMWWCKSRRRDENPLWRKMKSISMEGGQ